MMWREVLADTAAQRKRHRRRGGDGRGSELVGDVGVQATHQLDGGIEHGPAVGEKLSRA
jgi:hypothetical protein